MKDLNMYTIGGVAIMTFTMFFPWIIIFISHIWSDAAAWDCAYEGGSWVASTTWMGLQHICVAK